MNRGSPGNDARPSGGLLHRLRERGVLRVAASYAVIAWLMLQIASVVLDPLGVPKWVMTALIIASLAGFPVAIALAWFLRASDRGIEIESAPAATPGPANRGLRHYADAIAIGILLVTAAILAVRQSDLGRPKPPANPAIAVLPFENLSGDPKQEYFSDGLAEETIDRLGRVPGLLVIARSSSFSFKGKNLDAQTIAGKLGVTNILEGSVRRDGRHLRLTARLIDGATGQETWSGSFDRELTDVFSVQTELARAVVDAIIPAARGEHVKIAPAASADLSAYDLYLLAKQSQWQRSPEAVQRAVSLLERAIELDPNYAPAHAQLAIALYNVTGYSTQALDLAELRKRREVIAHRALALDPNLPDAHLALEMASEYRLRPEELVPMLQRALELNPNSSRARFQYGVVMGYEGRNAEYLQWMEKTLQVDPLAISARANVIGAADDRGDDRKRDQELLRARQLAATDADALYLLGRFYLRHFGDAVRAAEAARSSVALSPPSPTPDATTILHRALVKVGAFDEAERLLQSTDWSSRNPAVRAYEQAFAAGSRDDLAGLGAAIESVRALPADQVRTNALIFWQAVAGNCTEAHALLDYLAKVPHSQRITVVAGLENEQVDDATMWCLTAGGRHKEAQKAIDETRADLQSEVADHPRNVPALVELAAIESIEKNDDAAVASLDKAFKRSPTPYVFNPQVPWFTRLRGKPDYDRLVASWEAARDKARTQVLAANAMRTSDATSSASGR